MSGSLIQNTITNVVLYGTIQKLHSHHVTKISNRPQNQANHPYVPKLYQTNHLPQFFNQTKFASFRPPQSKVIQYNCPLSLSDTTGQMVKISNTHILSTTFLNHPQHTTLWMTSAPNRYPGPKLVITQKETTI